MPKARDTGRTRPETIDNPLRRRLLAGATATLAAGAAIATAAHAAPVGSPEAAGDDAELIGLCERLVAWEARYDEIYTTIEDEDEAARAADAIDDDFREIRDRFYQLGAPVTPEGQRSYARACLATASRDGVGGIILDDGGSLGSYLAFGLAHSLARRVIA